MGVGRRWIEVNMICQEVYWSIWELSVGVLWYI